MFARKEDSGKILLKSGSLKPKKNANDGKFWRFEIIKKKTRIGKIINKMGFWKIILKIRR